MKQKIGRKLLSFLLTLALVLGLMPGMGLTAYAVPTEELLTTITGAGSNANPATSANVSYSTDGVATLTFSEPTLDGNVVYNASPAWGWWGYDMTLTVTPAKGYTITKCVFYDNTDHTATDSSSPFVVETTVADKTPRVNNSIIGDDSKGIKKIEVYGYANAPSTVDVTGVTLNPSTAQSITVDGSVAFTATVNPGEATDKTVKWSVGGTNSDAVKLYSDSTCQTEVGTDATTTLTVYAKGTAAGSATVTATSNADSTKSASCGVTVNKTDPTTPTGLTATYGQKLSDVALPTGWTWVDSTTSVGNVVSPAATFKANFAGDDNYNAASNVDVTVTVGKADPTAPTGLTATYGQTLEDVTLPDGWTWADSAQSVGNVVDPAATFKANFAGDDNHNAASNVDVAVTVGKADPTAPTGLTATYGQTLADVSLPTGWTWADSMQSVGNVVDPAATFKANFAGNDNYNAASNVDVTVTVGKADPTAPTGLTATYGQTLEDVTLPDGWTWADSAQSVGNVVDPAATFKANYAGDDNHNAASNVDVAVTVGKAASAPATVAANNFTYDAAEHPLVTVTGEATGGAMQYALGEDATTAPASGWSASVPTATDAGTYYVWYKVQGDDDHFDVEAACVTVTVTTIVVSFEENGGSEVDDQIVPIGGKAVRPEDPTRLGYDFVDWYADEGCTEVFDFETVIEQNTVVYALWESVPFPETLTLAQDYLLLLPDDTFQLEVIDVPRAWLAAIAWSSDNEAVATVDDKGKVTAVSEGVAWIMATLDMESSALTALCRIDVTAEYPEVTAVRLVDTKATTNIYSTDYTRIEVLPELLQNHTADRSASADERGLGPVVTAIENARFADAATAAAFDLRVVDDRTLEIVPKDEFVQGDEAKLKTLKSRYKSAVIVTIDGREFTTPEMIQLSVKKTKPRITAKIKAFNSFIPGDTQAFVFSGGVPETVVVESAPAWLSVDTDALTAAYMGAVDLKLKDKVILNVKPKGWAFTTQVTVNVTVAKTAPKFSLSPSTVRLKPGVDALASANAVLGNADPALQEIAVLNVMEGKTNAEGALDVTVEGGVVTVRPGKEAPTDGKAHTYKVTLALLRNGMPTDATRTLTVRLLEESREVSVTAKAAGAIDPAIPESPVTVMLTAKNANAASVNVTEVTVAAAAGTAAPQDVTDRFDIEIDGLTVTFRQAGGAALDTSLTYTATIRTNVGAAATVKLTVKTNANPKPTVTLKAAGAIDVIRPDSAVTVTHKVKDCFTYEPSVEDLKVWKVVKVDGKRTYEPADDKFDVRMENGAYVLTLKPGTKVDHTKDKFAVSLSGALDGTPFESAKTDITVKLGSARIKQSTKSVTLLKDDRNSRGSVTITVATAGVNGIDWDKTLSAISIPKGKDGKPLFEVERIGQDIVIRFANSELKEFKSAKVKVPVFLLGNNSTKPNKTLSISVKLG